MGFLWYPKLLLAHKGGDFICRVGLLVTGLEEDGPTFVGLEIDGTLSGTLYE